MPVVITCFSPLKKLLSEPSVKGYLKQKVQCLIPAALLLHSLSVECHVSVPVIKGPKVEGGPFFSVWSVANGNCKSDQLPNKAEVL